MAVWRSVLPPAIASSAETRSGQRAAWVGVAAEVGEAVPVRHSRSQRCSAASRLDRRCPSSRYRSLTGPLSSVPDSRLSRTAPPGAPIASSSRPPERSSAARHGRARRSNPSFRLSPEAASTGMTLPSSPASQNRLAFAAGRAGSSAKTQPPVAGRRRSVDQEQFGIGAQHLATGRQAFILLPAAQDFPGQLRRRGGGAIAGRWPRYQGRRLRACTSWMQCLSPTARWKRHASMIAG